MHNDFHILESDTEGLSRQDIIPQPNPSPDVQNGRKAIKGSPAAKILVTTYSLKAILHLPQLPHHIHRLSLTRRLLNRRILCRHFHQMYPKPIKWGENKAP